MKKHIRRAPFWRTVFARTLVACLILVLCAGGLFILSTVQSGKNKVAALSFDESLQYTLKNTPNAVITVGVIKNGIPRYTVYGENGQILPKTAHVYEIGSITKTVTAAMVAKAVREGKIALDSSINEYLDLPPNRYPTIKQLLTHTSGYKPFYFESPMIANFFKRRNDFFGIPRELVLQRIGKITLKKSEYPFCYSNFGYAVLGLVLESVYKTDFASLVNAFALQDLRLPATHIATGGDLARYWAWRKNDAYIAAGALTSTIDDMLIFAALQMSPDSHAAQNYTALCSIRESTKKPNAFYERLDIRFDKIGYAWIRDTKNGFVWHNGGTDNQNSYIGFAPESQTAVVVLSNLSPNYRIPATVLGVKLLKESVTQK